MATIVLRNVKGSALTYTEVDNNFSNLNTDKAETANPTFTGTVTVQGNAAFSGTARRITGDLSNSTLASRLLVQNSVTNAASSFGIIPNGSGVGGNLAVFESQDPDNSGLILLGTNSTISFIDSLKVGSGTARPLSFLISGVAAVTISTSRNVTFAAPASGVAVTINGLAGQTAFIINTGVGTNGWQVSDGTASTSLFTNGSSGVVFNVSSNHPLSFRTNNTQCFQFEAGGDAVFPHVASGAGAWYDGSGSGKRAYLGMDLGSTTVFRLYSAAAVTNIATWNLTTGDFVAVGNVTAYSDERLKKDWAPLGVDFIDRLAGVRHGTYTRIDTGSRQVGVSAQSLTNVLPEAVQTANDENGTLSVAYGNAALAACVELAKEVVALRKRVSELEAR